VDKPVSFRFRLVCFIASCSGNDGLEVLRNDNIVITTELTKFDP